MANQLFASQNQSADPGYRRQSANTPMRVKAYTAATIGECLLRARKELGPDAVILSKRNVRRGGLFGIWGARNMVEVSFAVNMQAPDWGGAREGASSRSGAWPTTAEEPPTTYVQKLEAQIAGLTASVQSLVDTNKKKPATVTESRYGEGVETIESALESAAFEKRNGRGRSSESSGDNGYPSLMRQLMDAEVAAPLARQMLSELPSGLSTTTASMDLRTLISQRLLIANRIEVTPGSKMKLLAFVGTTGVGKTTTIAKLAAQYALVERRRVGVVTLDTQRIAAAQQLQTYGDILRVPVKIAHDKAELIEHLSEYIREGMEMVLLDTAGRSPNDMLPLGETAHLFEGMGAVMKFLAVPATLASRDMENIVARFQNTLAPDAMILTKLDEATDNACFGKLLTIQAKFGIPLAYVTTGQKVPDDIAFPDSHAIAARILSTAVL
jgi:flagellar biosynthesis protein FlhF